MPTSVAYDRDERIYVQSETTFGTIPNSAGAATLTGANSMRHISADLTPDITMMVREDKTGDRTRTPGEIGRFGGSWAINASMVTNGTAGVVPDNDPVMAATYQSAAVIKAGTVAVTSCVTGSTYNVTTPAHGLTTGDGVFVPASAAGAPFGPFIVVVVSSTVFTLLGANSAVAITGATVISKVCVVYGLGNIPAKSFTLWRFRTPSTLRQEVALGSLVSSVKWSGGEDAGAKVAWTGGCKWVLDSLSYADAIPDSDQKGGLTAFPAEPGSPVTNGGLIPSFMGYVVLNANQYVKIRSWALTHNTGADLPQEYIGTRYGQTPELDTRQTTADVVVDDDDSTALQLLYEAAQSMARIDMVLSQGTAVGNSILHYLRGVQLPVPKTGSTGRKFTRTFSGCVAHGSGVGTGDEMKTILL